jgi:hypothetical protein
MMPNYMLGLFELPIMPKLMPAYSGWPHALAALMTTDPAWGERWMAAELSDALRTVDRVCDAPADQGWTPRTFGHTEGDADPFYALSGGGGEGDGRDGGGVGGGEGGCGDGAVASSTAAGGRGEGRPDDDDGGVAGVPPAAEAAMEAVRRATARALVGRCRLIPSNPF